MTANDGCAGFSSWRACNEKDTADLTSADIAGAKQLMTAAAQATLRGDPDRVELTEKALRSLSDEACGTYGKPMSEHGKAVHLPPLLNSLRVERTEDVESMYSILRTEGIEEWIGDDGSELLLPVHARIYYLLAKIEIGVEPGAIEDRIIGCMAFQPVNGITWTPHLAILPQYRGMGTAALRAGIAWMFESTACRKLFAAPPEYNKAMARVFEKCEFNQEGFSPASVRKDGVLYGRNLLGRSR